MSVESFPSEAIAVDVIKYNDKGLVPAIIQDYLDGTVLMMAWMNQTALEETVKTGFATYWSRSRGKLWRKGESSGHSQEVHEMRLEELRRLEMD